MFNSQGAAWALDSLAEAKGDITATVKWKLDSKYVFGGGHSPVLSSGYIYYIRGYEYKRVLTTLVCLEAATGKECYEERLPDFHAWGGWTASPFATADGLIYVTSSGKSAVIKAGPKFEVVAINTLPDTSEYQDLKFSAAFSSAAISEGKIFILGIKKLWCIGKK